MEVVKSARKKFVKKIYSCFCPAAALQNGEAKWFFGAAVINGFTDTVSLHVYLHLFPLFLFWALGRSTSISACLIICLCIYLFSKLPLVYLLISISVSIFPYISLFFCIFVFIIYMCLSTSVYFIPSIYSQLYPSAYTPLLYLSVKWCHNYLSVSSTVLSLMHFRHNTWPTPAAAAN